MAPPTVIKGDEGLTFETAEKAKEQNVEFYM